MHAVYAARSGAIRAGGRLVKAFVAVEGLGAGFGGGCGARVGMGFDVCVC
jgi:hypothetical protein